MIAIDTLWLVVISIGFYQKHIGFLMSTNPNCFAAIAFYLLYAVGLVFFVITPSLEKGWLYALLAGALFGLICYGTYDLTNLTTIKNWPVIVTIVDMIWGSVFSGSVSLIVYLIASKIIK
jgi:uncharacterized membrane protein